jgi:serine/threonine protein kinase
MIAPKSACDLQPLSEILHDTLDGARQTAVTRHLDQCAYCREQLEQLTADAQWWGSARQTLRELQVETPGTLSSQNHSSPTSHARVAAQEHPHWVLGLLQPSDNPRMLGALDGLHIEAVIGQGGMGVVLKARDEKLQRFLAVKLLSPMLAGSGAARERFFREARAAAAVMHPNIVPIYAVSTERALPYLVMPYVQGGNLQSLLDADGPLAVERSLSIGLQVAEGLAAAHRQGIVHRDIKPANLMLDEGGFRILITDFGLARALDDATLTGSGMLAGTPQYMSPEQARGALVDHRSDIYSLGAVLYALATGRPPVRGNSTLDILRRIHEESPKSIVEVNESYPMWYERLVRWLMAPQPTDRPQSAEQVVELIRSALAHARAPHHVPVPIQLRGRPNSIPGFRTTSLLIGLVLGLSLAVVMVWSVLIPDRLHERVQDQQRAVSVPTNPVRQSATTMATPVEPWQSSALDNLLNASEQAQAELMQELHRPVPEP